MNHQDLGVSEWCTRKGNKRTENRDAGGFHADERQVVAVIVDATEKGSRGAAFAEAWVSHLLATAQADTALTPDAFLLAMRRGHVELRTAGFLSEVASYAVLVLNLETGDSWALNCGDCRIGTIGKTSDLAWLTPVHTCANPFGQEFTREHADMEARHTITRRLRVRRFDEPALTWLRTEEIKSWILATDGYWIEHLWHCRQLDELEDDASYLVLTVPPDPIKQDAHALNFMSKSKTTMTFEFEK